MKRNLSPFDLATCKITPGTTLIEASAGTGKTYSLAGLVLRLLLEGHASAIGKILVMTFTKAATAELVERIRKSVAEAAAAFAHGGSDDDFLTGLVRQHGAAGARVASAALRDLDDIEVSTIHSFCRRVLERHALEVGVPFELEYVENDRTLLQRAAEDFWRRTVYPAGRVAARVIADEQITPNAFVEQYRRTRRHPRLRIEPAALPLDAAIAGLESAGELGDAEVEAFTHALRMRFIEEVGPLFEREKRIASVAGYDDLLHRLHRRLSARDSGDALWRAVAVEFDAVLVDEFQDTDELQLEIFDKLFEGKTVFYVGDPKQAIYAFRGADVFAYLRAKNRAANIYTMTTNWRSETPLVAGVNTLFTRVADPFIVDDIPFANVGAAGRADQAALRGDARKSIAWIWLPPDTSKERGRASARHAVCSEVLRLLDPASGVRLGDKPVEPHDIAVLVRQNRDAEAMQAALREVGVPAVVSQAGSVFQSEEAHELATLLRSVLDPYRTGAVAAALATRAWALDAAAIDRHTNDDARWQQLGETLAGVRQVWLARGFAAMASLLLDTCGARANLLAGDGGQRRLTNMLHLIELCQQAIVELTLSPDAVVGWLADRIADDKGIEKEISELRLESDDDAVQIVTIHKSKGLEYDIVFVPFGWDAKDLDKDEALVHVGDEVIYQFPKIPDEIAKRCDAETASEEMRVAYVALTRAKHRCYIPWGALGKNGSQASALARLVDPSLPASIVERSATADTETLSERWRCELAALCKAHPDEMSVHDSTPPETPARWQPPARTPLELRNRVFPVTAESRLEPWRVASFSSLRSAAAAPRGAAERPDYVDPEAGIAKAEAAPRGIFAFARGAKAGVCLHSIFEKADFARADNAALDALVARALEQYGLTVSSRDPTSSPAADVAAMVRTVLVTKLPGEAFALAAIARARRLSEWQFFLPTARISAARFAEAFERHGRGMAGAEYAQALRALGDRGAAGFLTGFVDLVFMHEDRWFVIDWKSNHLGNEAGDYGDAAIAHAMREHHYVLQYHLYVLALHRYLRQRVAGYDYERHMGGVFYAFVRGIRPDARGCSSTGWFADRPPRALVEALDALVADGEAP